MSAIVDIILLIVIFVMILAGIKNGFVRCVLSIVAFTLAFAAAVFLSEPAAQTVYDNFAKEPIESAIAERITDTGTAQTAADSTQAAIDKLLSLQPAFPFSFRAILLQTGISHSPSH